MDERFRIDGDLLAGPGGDGRWNNLGYWAGAADYTDAARALARLHGAAAGLRPGTRLLELACGHGAGLDLWADEFGVRAACALDVRLACVAGIEARSPGSGTRLALGRFDEPMGALVGEAPFDAILCVDAAYHARSLADFLAACRPVLGADGTLAFSTLIPGPGYGAPGTIRRGTLRSGLALAGVPAASFVDRQELIDAIAAADLDVVALHDLTDAVFAGFAAWVARRERSLRGVARRSSGWRKIRLTALLCRWLLSSRAMDYLLVVTRARPISRMPASPSEPV